MISNEAYLMLAAGALTGGVAGWLFGRGYQLLMDNPRPNKTIRMTPNHGEPLITEHLRGELADGQKFVYCPVGNIVSWSGGDYDHRWCHWCKKFFVELNPKGGQ